MAGQTAKHYDRKSHFCSAPSRIHTADRLPDETFRSGTAALKRHPFYLFVFFFSRFLQWFFRQKQTGQCIIQVYFLCRHHFLYSFTNMPNTFIIILLHLFRIIIIKISHFTLLKSFLLYKYAKKQPRIVQTIMLLSAIHAHWLRDELSETR